MIIIGTERLILRLVTEEDVSFILRLLNSPGWLKYIGDRGVKTEKDALKYIQDKIIDSYAKNGFGLYCIELKDAREPAGLSGLVKRDGLDHPDLGFALLPEYEKKGYALEAAKAVMEFATKELKLARIAAITVPDNQSSASLLQKLGFAFQKYMQLPGNEEKLMLFELV